MDHVKDAAGSGTLSRTVDHVKDAAGSGTLHRTG